VIFGLETEHPLPDGWTAIEAVAVVKCINEDAKPALVLAATPSLSSWEALGMLEAGRDTTAADLRECFYEDDE
jgi:hypothetical protein